MPQVSVIVPVYNIEKYLRECIDSILLQSFADFELILVDDGSKDASGAICDEYGKKDSRVRVIHKQNAGVSAARNTGIEAATGEYIMFVDADDWVDSDIIAFLYECLTNNNVDVATCYNIHEYVNNKEIVRKPFGTKLLSGKEAKIEMLLGNITEVSPDYKLMETSIVKQLRFPNISYAEDMLFMYDLFSCAKSVFLTDVVKYHYRQRKSSGARNYTAETIDKLFKKFEAMLLEETDKSVRKAIMYRMISYSFIICTSCSKPIYKKIQSIVKNTVNLLGRNLSDHRVKQQATLLSFPYCFFRLTYNLRNLLKGKKKQYVLYDN